MREVYLPLFKKFFHEELLKTRCELQLTQAKVASRLEMDIRSYVEQDHGKSTCSALTLILFLLYCCSDPEEFLEKLRKLFEGAWKEAA